jgi:hypothetical protein
MATLSDFGGILKLTNSTGGAVAAGDVVTIQANRFLVDGPENLGGSLANGATIRARPIGAWDTKVLVAAAKTAAQAWTPGQTVYLITGTNVWTSTKGTNLVGGIVVNAAASADTVGDVLPGIPFVAAV